MIGNEDRTRGEHEKNREKHTHTQKKNTCVKKRVRGENFRALQMRIDDQDGLDRECEVVHGAQGAG